MAVDPRELEAMWVGMDPCSNGGLHVYGKPAALDKIKALQREVEAARLLARKMVDLSEQIVKEFRANKV